MRGLRKIKATSIKGAWDVFNPARTTSIGLFFFFNYSNKYFVLFISNFCQFFLLFFSDVFFNYLLFGDVLNPARTTSIGLAELAAGVERLGLLLHHPSAAGSRALIAP